MSKTTCTRSTMATLLVCYLIFSGKYCIHVTICITVTSYMQIGSLVSSGNIGHTYSGHGHLIQYLKTTQLLEEYETMRFEFHLKSTEGWIGIKKPFCSGWNAHSTFFIIYERYFIPNRENTRIYHLWTHWEALGGYRHKFIQIGAFDGFIICYMTSQKCLKMQKI